ncbi:MAG: DUF2273 domain-containing protein [Eggerthella lenta]
MTQSTMRIHQYTPAPKSAPTVAGGEAYENDERLRVFEPEARRAEGSAACGRTHRPTLANAAAETKRDKGVYASMKRVRRTWRTSHAVLYGIIGFVAAASSSSWDLTTVLLAVFAAIGVVIGKYRDGDRKTRQQMKQVLERFN